MRKVLILCFLVGWRAWGADAPAPAPLYALREMDMHLHAGLERQLPLNDWLNVAAADGRKALVLLDHLELYRMTRAEYAKWAEEGHFRKWYPMGSEGHRALMADFDKAAARKDLVIFKGWEIGESELDEGIETMPMKMADVIGWHISPNHKGKAPDGQSLIHRIQQIKDVQKQFPVPMILFHPFSMRLEHLMAAEQKAGRDWKALTTDACRFFKPGEQEEVVRLLKDTSIYIEMSRGTEGYWDIPAMREAIIADVKPLAEAGVKFTVSTDSHSPADMKRPFDPARYCEPCGITVENANALVRDLLARKTKQAALFPQPRR